MAKLDVRAARTAEIPLISDSWVKSFGPQTRRGPMGDSYLSVGRPKSDIKIAPNLWWESHRRTVADLLSNCAIVVVVHPSAPDVVLGWLAFDGGVDADGESTLTLHYCWVRKSARRKGVGSLLLQTALAQVPEDQEPRIRLSHSTPDGEALLESFRLI